MHSTQACTSQKALGLAWAGEAFAPSACGFILDLYKIKKLKMMLDCNFFVSILQVQSWGEGYALPIL